MQRRDPTAPLVAINLRILPATRAELDYLWREMQIPRNQIVEQALSEFRKRFDEQKPSVETVG